MTIVGIIAEYNPFHNGHLYQIEYIKEALNPDYIVVVMNGDFLQRGEPAYWDKYLRARMAVAKGADAVFLLPPLYGTSSAEYFALGGVRLLHELGGITHLSFGCETTDLALLNTLAKLISEEPPEYQTILQKKLAEGLSYPESRSIALRQVLSNSPYSDSYSYDTQELATLLHSPNTILGIEYMKALNLLNSHMKVLPCQRNDAGYHHKVLASICSASAIRHAFAQGSISSLEASVPPEIYPMLQQISPLELLTMEDLYPYIQYQLWQPGEQWQNALDLTPDLLNRINKLYDPADSYHTFVEKLASKQYTYSRIKRCLLHIMLQTNREFMQEQKASNSMHYARLLAIHPNSHHLLSYLNDTSSIPIVHHLARFHRQIQANNPVGAKLLDHDLSVSHLYQIALSRKTGQPFIHEYKRNVFHKYE